jgi:M6 family metalloprotease-like protein
MSDPSLPLRPALAPGNLQVTRRVLTVALAIALVSLATSARSQPVAPAPGVAMPAWLGEYLRDHPDAYNFQHAFVEKARHQRENRRLAEAGRFGAGLDREVLRRATTMTGTLRLPVLLARFSNTATTPIMRADLQSELFGGAWPTGSLSQYFNEVSYGNFQVTGTVYDWVQASGTDTYYAGQAPAQGLMPNGRSNLLVLAAVAANDAAVNFGQYDNDGPDGVPNSGDDDGYVDVTVVVQPKQGGEGGDLSAIWSHRSSLTWWGSQYYTTNDPSAKPGFGNIRVNDYFLCPALSNASASKMIEIGVFCHEFGHALGLPDLYDLAESTLFPGDCFWSLSYGVGYWCLMGAGNWNTPERPAHLSAWCKARLGWLQPVNVTSNLWSQTIASSSVSPTAYRLWTGGASGPEYFLVENRTRSGFDDQLKKAGLLVWHVNEAQIAKSVSVWRLNDDECVKTVDLECADQTGAEHGVDGDQLDAGTNAGDTGDPFCAGVFNGTSVPSSVSYGGTPTNVEVSGIQNCNQDPATANLLVTSATGIVRLVVRDCVTQPCYVYWESPDIWINKNGDPTPEPPVAGKPNRLVARVWNQGNVAAANVTVGFYWSTPAMGNRYPSQANLIGTASIPLLPAGGSATASVIWSILPSTTQIGHYCVGVLASHPADVPTSQVPQVEENLALINIDALYRKAGVLPPALAAARSDPPPPTFEATRKILACNPDGWTRRVHVEVGHPPAYDDAEIPPPWQVTFGDTVFVLAPGACDTVTLTVTNPYPEHGQHAVIPLTLVGEANVTLGGTDLEFHVDNVPLAAPMGGQALLVMPLKEDAFPGERSVWLTWDQPPWDEGYLDDRAQYWLVYRGEGEGEGFPPDSAHLVETVVYSADAESQDMEAFVAAPPVATDVWFKIVAVDRAGNLSQPCTFPLYTEYRASVEPGGPAGGPRLLRNLPNPFAGATAIAFMLPADGQVRIAVYSADGRLVRRLLDGHRPAGAHRVTWDGRDERGYAAPTGVYLCRLTYGGRQSTGLMQLIR